MATPIRRGDDIASGRIIALPTSQNHRSMRDQQLDDFRTTLSVDFPAMPETIELARSADYAVDSNIIAPDGIHQYKGTKPMEIPLSFKLHFMDSEYCKEGALTLLKLGARLHSLVLPINMSGSGTSVVPLTGRVSSGDVDNPQGGKGTGSDEQVKKDANGNNLYVAKIASGDSNKIFPPVTCLLHLMMSGYQQHGISSVGYVKDVKVVFHGPWNRGPSSSFNLPTSAEYSFTFAVAPGYGNAIGFTESKFGNSLAATTHFYADDIKDKLYNTRGLAQSVNYQGFRTEN